jgi:hypothetical protein
MIRNRRLPPSLFRRRRYEVALIRDASSAPEWTRVTSTPVTLIDRHLGVGDAWSVVQAADDAWDGDVGEWVSFPPPTATGPEPLE